MKELRMAVVIPAYNEEKIDGTLQALYNQTSTAAAMHYIVDNGSTDTTMSVIRSFMDTHDGFPLTVVEEAAKGTGSACNKGFGAAIDAGFNIIARTDADTRPSAGWSSSIYRNFAADDALRLLGGRTTALRDTFYKQSDDVLLPFGRLSSMIAKTMLTRRRGYIRAALGHNMATTAGTFEALGGFAVRSIAEGDEDVDYSLRVRHTYGRSAIGYDRSVLVATSMRRSRSFSGLIDANRYYLFPHKRQSSSGSIDIRG